MIISPYKSKYFQCDPRVLKNAVDDCPRGIDEEIVMFIHDEIETNDKESTFPAMIAGCLINDENLIDYILSKGANVNAGVDYYGNSCAHIAIQNENLSLLQKLIAHGADLEDRRSWNQVTLLHTAVYRKNYAIAEYLIEQGADVNAPCHGKYKGITPLITAVELESKDIAELLLKNGANNISPMILKGIPRKYCYITPRDFFVPFSMKFDCNILEQSTLTTLPPDIQVYYFQRFLDISFCHEIDNLLKGQKIITNSFFVGDERVIDCKFRYNENIIKIWAVNGSDPEKIDVVELEKHAVFQAKCEKELDWMKSLLLPGTSIPWRDVFLLGPITIADIFDENSIPYDIDYMEKLFPLYGGMLYYNVILGYQRRELYDAIIALNCKSKL